MPQGANDEIQKKPKRVVKTAAPKVEPVKFEPLEIDKPIKADKVAPKTKRILNVTAAKRKQTKVRATKAAAKAPKPEDDGLSEDARRFIVESLAAFTRVNNLIADVKELFGVDVSRQRLQHYNPTTIAGRKLRAELIELFHASRFEYLSQIENVGIASQRYRIEMLQRVADKAEERGALALVMKAAEQAAMEMGGRYSSAAAAGEGLEFLARLMNVPVSELPAPMPPKKPSAKK